MDHGAAVEEVRMLSSGTLCVSLGKSHTCIWDLRASGKLLKEFKNNKKSSSSLCLTTEIADDLIPRLAVGDLDGNVKIHEMSRFKVSYSWKYHSPVLTLGVSPNLCSMAVGMADGTFCLRNFSGRVPPPVRMYVNSNHILKSHKQTSHQSSIIRRNNGNLSKKLCVVSNSNLRHKYFNYLSKSFRYSDAVGAALSSRSPDIVMAIIEEYTSRGILRMVLTDCKFAYIASILDFLSKYLNTPSYTRTLINVS
jgi:U3 small nucleolar RNA-associated protein 15